MGWNGSESSRPVQLMSRRILYGRGRRVFPPENAPAGNNVETGSEADCKQPYCECSMGDSSEGCDEEGMEEWVTSYKRKKQKEKKGSSEDGSDHGSQREGGAAKKVKANQGSTGQGGTRQETEEWKVVIVFGREIGHFHPVQMTKVIGKFLNNRRVLISATSKQQQVKLLKLDTLDGIKIMTHVPGIVAKLRGVISNVPI